MFARNPKFANKRFCQKERQQLELHQILNFIQT